MKGKKALFLLFGLVFAALLLISVKWSESELPPGESRASLVQPVLAPAPDFPVNAELKAALVFEVAGANVSAAYQQILAEEGFAFELLPAKALLKHTPRSLKESYAALILPERVNRQIAPSVARLLEEYVTRFGGKVFIGADAGTLDEKGGLREKGLFSSVAGLQYEIPPGFSDEKQNFFEGREKGILLVPGQSPLRKYFDPGLFDHDALKVFDNPPLKDSYFPLTNVTAGILAYTGREGFPENGSVLQKNYPGGGVVLSVNGSPGLLKAGENVDFFLRALLKYFLLELVGLPRLVASPGGVAGLVVAIHVCSGAYFRDLDRIFAWKLLSREIPFSFYVTAGPDNDRPGDKRGVDVLNPKKGRRYVELLSRYGSIGAHGGWQHNYWAYRYQELSDEEKKDYIDRNFQALFAATGQPVSDYAAPGGAHDPKVNDFLAAWEIKAASLPVAFNSPPTHAWFNGQPEKRFWLFGYTGTIYGTAFENMLAGGRKPSQIESDIRQLIDYLVEQREIRLLYFHPVSIARHPEMWRAIQSYILKYAEEGNLSVRTMGDFADFLTRHEKVRFSVRKSDRGYYISATCPDSLKEMTFALPAAKNARLRNAAGLKIKEKNGWAYVTILKDTNKAAFLLPLAKSGAYHREE
ncbi:MAG: hypothetical protein AB1556_02580 [Bacillota bacterium]